MKKILIAVAGYFKPQKYEGSVYKNRPSDIIFHTINITILLLITLICIIPFYFLLVNTLSSYYYVSRNLVRFWPRGWTFENYLVLFDVGDFWQALWITVARTVIGTAAMVLVSAFAGYIFSKRTMWQRKLFYRMVIIPMFFNAGMIPWFVTMMSLGLTDNFLGFIIPMMLAPFNIILVKTYIESLPKEMEESAKIDGAGILTIFFKMMLPMSIPILATITIFGAVAHWNSLQDSLILMMNRQDLYVLQHRLFIHMTQEAQLRESLARSGAVGAIRDLRVVQYTLAMTTALPIILVYPLLQRFFIKGIMVGAVKG